MPGQASCAVGKPGGGASETTAARMPPTRASRFDIGAILQPPLIPSQNLRAPFRYDWCASVGECTRSAGRAAPISDTSRPGQSDGSDYLPTPEQRTPDYSWKVVPC